MLTSRISSLIRSSTMRLSYLVHSIGMPPPHVLTTLMQYLTYWILGLQLFGINLRSTSQISKELQWVSWMELPYTVLMILKPQLSSEISHTMPLTLTSFSWPLCLTFKLVTSPFSWHTLVWCHESSTGKRKWNQTINQGPYLSTKQFTSTSLLMKKSSCSPCCLGFCFTASRKSISITGT